MKKKPMVGILALGLLVLLAGCRREVVHEVTRGAEHTERAEVNGEQATAENSERPAATERLVVGLPTDGAAESVMPSSGATEAEHQHSYCAVLIAPTCTDEGYTSYTCDCGDSYRGRPVAALGHALVVEVVPPTASERGYTKHTCTRCQYTYEDTYTGPVRQVYDIEAAMAAGNSYALSLGFGYIDYGLTPDGAGYYPATVLTGEQLGADGQSWLEQELCGKAQSLYANLTAEPWFVPAECGVRAYISYDAATDTYICYLLY